MCNHQGDYVTTPKTHSGEFVVTTKHSYRCTNAFIWRNKTTEEQINAVKKKGIGAHFFKNNALPTLDRLFNHTKQIIDPDGKLYICGPCGSGKTLALACLVNKYVEMGHDVLYVSWEALKLEIRSCYNQNATKTEIEVINKYAEVDILMLDDLGAGKESEASRTVLFQILDKRYSENKKTNVTSNWTLSDIVGIFDSRIGRRIESMCKVCVLK